jgi:DNA-binding response OmpR family regulator
MNVRCVIVDDSQPFLHAATTLLEREGLTVAAVASTIAEALPEIDRVQPDVVLVDVSLGDESGFELARRINDQNGDQAVVILISTRPEVDLADLLALSPAAGFISKSKLSAESIRGLLGGT